MLTHQPCLQSAVRSLHQDTLFNKATFLTYDGAIKSLSSINQFGSKECVAFRDKIISKHIALASVLRAEYEFIARTKSYVDANRRFLELDKRLTLNGFSLCSSHEDLVDLSRALAKKCERIKGWNYNCIPNALDACNEIAATYSIQFTFDTKELEPCCWVNESS